MNVKRELTIKPSCTRELLGFPPQRAPMLWEKISYLMENPIPDGKLKKKLRGREDVFRLRVGDHRLFYSFGDNWIRLLALRKRDTQTYNQPMTYEAPPILPPETDDDLDDLELVAPLAPPVQLMPSSPGLGPAVRPPTPVRLPAPISASLLEALRVPPLYFPVLLPCTSEDELLNAPVPEDIIQRVVDNLFPRPLSEVLQQPDLVVQQGTRDLIQFKEGTLLSFLLKLDPEQSELVRWALKGPTLVKGGAGTGKSTVALYRVKALLEQPKATGAETVLFTTYTRALQAASTQLLGQLLNPQQLKRVRVATCDQVAREIVASRRKVGTIEPPGFLEKTLEEVRAGFFPSGENGFERKLRARAVAKLPDDYLLDEFAWVIEGQGLTTLEAYLAAPRPGRRIPLGGKLRTSVWELHQAVLQGIASTRMETWSGLRAEALKLVRSGTWATRYDYVVVDEAQDLPPITLCLMAELAKSPEGIFFASDSKQSIYSRSHSWSIAHPRLDFKGRTAVLRQNHRSTAEIDRAAFSILSPEEDDALTSSASINSGPLPVLVRGSSTEESTWTVQFIRQMSSHLRLKLNAAAVLVPKQKVGEALAEQLVLAGLPAKFYPGKELDLNASAVKVLTLHSAKGLEFPTVVICGLRPGTYPVAADFEDPAEFEENLAVHRRLLYVGMTRAMRGLMIIQPADCEDPVLKQLNTDYWNVQGES